MKVSIKTGDTVYVNSGKDAGKQGKVLAVNKNKDSVKVLVEGVNIVTKAKKARTAQDKSELVKVEAAIDVSNVNVVCPSCGKATRVRHSITGDKKSRICAKCGAVLDSKFAAASKAKKSAKAEAKSEVAETAEKPAKTVAEKPAAEKKSKTTKSAPAKEKATKTASAKKPTTARASQRGV